MEVIHENSFFQASPAGLKKDHGHFPFQRPSQVSSMFHLKYNKYEVEVTNIQSDQGFCRFQELYIMPFPKVSSPLSDFLLGCFDFRLWRSWNSEDFFRFGNFLNEIQNLLLLRIYIIPFTRRLSIINNIHLTRHCIMNMDSSFPLYKTLISRVFFYFLQDSFQNHVPDPKDWVKP